MSILGAEKYCLVSRNCSAVLGSFWGSPGTGISPVHPPGKEITYSGSGLGIGRFLQHCCIFFVRVTVQWVEGLIPFTFKIRGRQCFLYLFLVVLFLKRRESKKSSTCKLCTRKLQRYHLLCLLCKVFSVNNFTILIL